MKTLLLIAAILTTGAFTGASQVLLHGGDTYTYQFNTLPFESHVTNGVAAPFGFFSLPIFPSDLGPTGMLRMEMFENTTSETPIFSRTLTSSSSLGDTHATAVGAWGDVQGAIRLTMLSGSLTINIFSLEAVTAASPSGFDVYGDRVIPVVPEPGPFALVGLSSLTVAFCRRNHKERARI